METILRKFSQGDLIASYKQIYPDAMMVSIISIPVEKLNNEFGFIPDKLKGDFQPYYEDD